MNQDKLKANKLSDRGLSTRKIFASSQVPPRSLVIPFILLGVSVFFFYWFYNGLSLQQNNLNQKFLMNNKKLDSIKLLIEREYRDVLYPDDLKDPSLLDESRRVLDELTQIFGTGSIYEFQKL